MKATRKKKQKEELSSEEEDNNQENEMDQYEEKTYNDISMLQVN